MCSAFGDTECSRLNWWILGWLRIDTCASISYQVDCSEGLGIRRYVVSLCRRRELSKKGKKGFNFYVVGGAGKASRSLGELSQAL